MWRVRDEEEMRIAPRRRSTSSLVCSKARSSMSSITHSSPALHRRSSSPTRAHHGHHLPSRLRTQSSFHDPDQPFVESPQSSTTAGAGCAEDSPDPATDHNQHATAADPGATGLHDVAEEQGDNWLPDPQVVERPAAAERASSLSPSTQTHRERVELTPSPPPPPPSLSSRSSRRRPRSLLLQSATRRRSSPPSGPPSPRPTSSRSTRTRTGRRARRASTRAGSTSPTSRAASSSRSPTMPHTAPSSPS